MVPACAFRQPYRVFLFVGSSALTEASLPRDLAIPQLLLSSACAIVLTMKASPRAVFPHRGFAPHQFTPMSGAHNAPQTTATRFGVIEWSGRMVKILSYSSAVSELDPSAT